MTYIIQGENPGGDGSYACPRLLAKQTINKINNPGSNIWQQTKHDCEVRSFNSMKQNIAPEPVGKKIHWGETRSRVYKSIFFPFPMPKKRKSSRTKARKRSTLEREVQKIERNRRKVTNRRKKNRTTGAKDSG